MKFFLLMTLISCAATFALADGDENESSLFSDSSANDDEVADYSEGESDEEMDNAEDENLRWLAPVVYDDLVGRERRSFNTSQTLEDEEEQEKEKKKKKKGGGKKGKKKNKKKNKKNKPLKKYTEKEKKLWFQPVGCFRDKGPRAYKYPELRALKVLYRNQRGNINWRVTWQDFSNVIMKCSRFAQILGCPCFGVQFYGECWCDKKCSFRIYGRSRRCYKGVGLHWANFVYRGRCGSVYGCCPDGAMPALGPNHKGCPDCTTAVDLIFVIDASGSIGRKNFLMIKKILLKLIRHFSVSTYHARIGIIKYSNSARPVFRLRRSQRSGYRALAKTIRRMSYTRGGTQTGKAMAMAERWLKNSKRKLRGQIIEHDQVVGVVTDGLTNKKDAKRLKVVSTRLKKRAHVIAVGVTGKGYNAEKKKQQKTELSEIASSKEDLFYEPTFEQVKAHVDPIAKRACPLVYKKSKGKNKGKNKP